MLGGRETGKMTQRGRRIALSCAVVSLLACSDEQEYQYSDLNAARKAGALTYGEVPEFLPPDAENIKQVIDVDFSATWGCFTSPSGPGSVRERLAALKATRISGRIDPGRLRIREWWPDEFRGTVSEVHLLTAKGMTIKVGLDARTNTVCYFRGRPPA